MFALQLTETPVATGAKTLRAAEAIPTPGGAVMPDFQTFLGQARGAVQGTGPLAEAGPVVPGEGVLALPIERLPRTGTRTALTGHPPTIAGDLPAQPVDGTAAGQAGPDLDAALPRAADLPATALPEGQPVADDMEHSPTQWVEHQEAVPARALSPDTGTGHEAQLPDLSPSAIPDDGFPQPTSGIPSGPTPIDVTEVPGETARTPVDETSEEIGLPEQGNTETETLPDLTGDLTDASSADLSRDADDLGQDSVIPLAAVTEQVALRRAAGDIAAQTQALPEGTDARAQTPADALPRPLQMEQPVGEAAFARVLTEVSIATVPAPTPAQSAQQGASPAPVQTQVPLDLSQPGWADRFVEDVSLQALGRGDTLTLTLTPERLGTMQVRLEMLDGQTHVHFITDTPEAARLLTEAQSRLADLMSRAGVDLGSQSASTGQGGQQNDRPSQGAPIQDGLPVAPQESGAEAVLAPSRPAAPVSRSTVDVVA